MEIVQSIGERVLQNVQQVIVGKDNEIRLTLLGLLCEGHLLIEDVPGVGKTMLARAIAAQHRLYVSAHPVHAGHAAQRRHRRQHLQSEDAGV